MRALTENEKNRLAQLTSRGLKVGLLQPTSTALEKSIIDAIEPFRLLLSEEGIHDYANQKQGIGYKVQIPAQILIAGRWKECEASLYRPETKKGDPRIWFARLGQLVGANNILAIVPINNELKLLNLSAPGFEESLQAGLLDDLLAGSDRLDAIAAELLAKLRKLAAAGPIPSVGHGDTAIGKTLEAALGIKQNSSKKPDFKGIELKSSRSGKNKVTLFAQVPDWELSGCDSIAKILALFGYGTDPLRLYCTVRASGFNPKGLRLRVDPGKDRLVETSNIRDNVAVWRLQDLRDRLLEKHAATFWVAAPSVLVDGSEHFVLESVTYTRNPQAGLIGELIASDVITLDHAIEMRPSGSPQEKGPLFRMSHKDKGLLFAVRTGLSLK